MELLFNVDTPCTKKNNFSNEKASLCGYIDRKFNRWGDGEDADDDSFGENDQTTGISCRSDQPWVPGKRREDRGCGM